jgi:hypothetical protein
MHMQHSNLNKPYSISVSTSESESMVRKRTRPQIHLLQLLPKLEATPSDLTTISKPSFTRSISPNLRTLQIYADAKETKPRTVHPTCTSIMLKIKPIALWMTRISDGRSESSLSSPTLSNSSHKA